jgi:prepilin-type N-terminal cleavage/methylation domain-containing protein
VTADPIAMNTLHSHPSSSSLVLANARNGSRTKDEGRGRGRSRTAFTLIELLVVIGIIAILAALLFPAGAAVKRKATLSRVTAEIKQVEGMINSYQLDKGFYPPDNKQISGPLVSVVSYPNSLYYELRGARALTQQSFVTLDERETNTVVELQSAFRVPGINNLQLTTVTDGPTAKDYLGDISSARHARVDFGAPAGIKTVLGTKVDGPLAVTTVDGDTFNPFHYVATTPTNNVQTFDLWVDIIVGGKTNRISNWSDKPLEQY